MLSWQTYTLQIAAVPIYCHGKYSFINLRAITLLCFPLSADPVYAGICCISRLSRSPHKRKQTDSKMLKKRFWLNFLRHVWEHHCYVRSQWIFCQTCHSNLTKTRLNKSQHAEFSAVSFSFVWLHDKSDVTKQSEGRKHDIWTFTSLQFHIVSFSSVFPQEVI